MTSQPFDDLTDVYEAIVDWPKRLSREAPFYRRLFEGARVHRVLDVACGTGRHAAMFRSWGLCVEGSDISPTMIERARQEYGEGPDLRWVQRGFDQPIESGESFDAAICVGNSLALAPDGATAERAIARMLEAVREQGLVVVHLLNLWRLADGPCVWQKCCRATLSGRDVLIVKGIHRCGPQAYVDVIVAELDTQPNMRTQSMRLLGFEASELERMAHAAGAAHVAFYGGYEQQPYEREESPDLIMVATKGPSKHLAPT